MDFPHYFADAEADFDKASYVIVGVPFEKRLLRHGADKAPFEIRQASWNFEQFDLKNYVNIKDIQFHDYGDLEVKQCTSKNVFNLTKSCATALLKKQKIPLVMGGDHSITPGLVAAYPKDIAVLSLDAHMDFRNEYKNDPHNHACIIRRITDHIDIENIALLGIRSAEQEEYNQALIKGLFFLDAFAIHKMKIKTAIEETKKHLKDKKIYLTLDIDVVDPAFAPGTSTPEPFGLTPLDIVDIIEAFSPQIIGFDLVEVCPPYDQGQTAILAAKLIRICIESLWKNHEGVT